MPTSVVSQVGRPRQFELDDVLSQALNLFWRKGYRHTTTRALETELGITQSSLYNAFGSKAGLLDAVLDRYQSTVDEALLHPLRHAADGRSALETFFRDVGAWMATDGRGCLMVNLMADEAPTNPAVAARTKAHRDRVRAALRVAVDRTCPTAGSDVVKHRANLLLAATLGLNIAARAGASRTELSRIVAGVEAEIASWTTP
jgi:TetR/AcrR family transcriptional repressor of nem operon